MIHRNNLGIEFPGASLPVLRKSSLKQFSSYVTHYKRAPLWSRF